jgi:hypothetical protein
MDDCTTGVFGSSLSSSVQVSAAVCLSHCQLFHSSISASPGKSLRIFMCRELRSQLAPVYKNSIRFISLLWRKVLLSLSTKTLSLRAQKEKQVKGTRTGTRAGTRIYCCISL